MSGVAVETFDCFWNPVNMQLGLYNGQYALKFVSPFHGISKFLMGFLSWEGILRKDNSFPYILVAFLQIAVYLLCLE